jgi:uncharacterized protein (DUF433 family)
MKTHLSERVSMDPLICHGKPVVTGTRVLVSQVVGALAGGDSVETVIEDYPSISREDVIALARCNRAALPARLSAMLLAREVRIIERRTKRGGLH